MVTTAVDADQTWRLLWSHTAYQVVSALSTHEACESSAVGYGWGLRHTSDPSRAVLLHPTAHGREIGDLSLTVCGKGTHIIPRCNTDFVHYLHTVSDVVETVVAAHLLA